MIVGYRCRCGQIVQMKNMSYPHSKQMKMHLVQVHGYSNDMSFRQEWKLLKNYFTGEPITEHEAKKIRLTE